MITLMIFYTDIFLWQDIQYYKEREEYLCIGDMFLLHIIKFIIYSVLSIAVALLIKKYIAIPIVLYCLYLIDIVSKLLFIRKLKGENKNDGIN